MMKAVSWKICNFGGGCGSVFDKLKEHNIF